MTKAGRVGRRDGLLQESIAAVSAESNRLACFRVCHWILR
jgi:hypothetical protein